MYHILVWILSFPMPVLPPETEEQARARHQEIARDLASVVYDSAEPALFEGEYGRSKTLRVLQGIAYHESGKFHRDVDFGIGPRSRGNGTSVCLMQINVGAGRTSKWNRVKGRYAYDTDPAEELDEGWTAKDLLSDRKKCFKTGLRMAHESFRRCGRNVPLEFRLRPYTSGDCEHGGRESRIRISLGITEFEKNKPEFTDSFAIGELSR